MAYKIPYLPCKKRTAACISLWWKVPAVFLLPNRPVPCIGSIPEVLQPRCHIQSVPSYHVPFPSTHVFFLLLHLYSISKEM